MTQQTIAAVTGRRKITASMLEAWAQLPGLHEATTPGKALSAFKRASPALGIPRRLVDLVDYLVGRTFAADWQGGPIVAWPSNATLCDALDVGQSQIKVLIRVGQELGLFQMRDAPNGQRYGHRGADGRVLEAYGFDLAPLAARRHEFEQIATAHAERRAEGRRMRRRITATRNSILSLCDLARETGAPGDWLRLDADARLIAAQRGDCYEPPMLGQILAQLTLMHDGAAEALAPRPAGPVGASSPALEQAAPIACAPAPMPDAAVLSAAPSGPGPVDNPAVEQADKGSEAVKIGPMGPENRPLLTPTKITAIPKGNTNAPATLTESLKDKQQATPAEKSDGRKRAQESALRGFVITLDFILRIAPAFQAWIKTSAPTWRDLLEASFWVRSELGISQHAWAQACVILGQTEAIAAIAAISARHAAGQVRSPGGLLRKMVELHQKGTLRLDRTLFGLADALKDNAAH